MHREKREKMEISLLDFIRTGAFGSVRTGQSEEYVTANFPPPDDVWDAGHGAFIRTYGGFEFHFRDGVLTLLWCDLLSYLTNPDKGQYKLDKWLLDDPDRMTVFRFCSLLDMENIAYTPKGTFFSSVDQGLPDNVILSIDNADTEIYFEDTEEDAETPWDYRLTAIGATQSKAKINVFPIGDMRY